VNTAGFFSAWQYRALILTIVCAAVGYLGFSLWSGWREVSQALQSVGLLGILLVLMMSLINYGLRFIRWQGYLQTLGHQVPWQPSLKIYLAGFALTTTPGKAGEALRGVLLKPLGVPLSHSLAAFFSERLSDLFAIVLLTLFGLTLYPESHILIWIGIGCIALAFLVLSQQKLLALATQRLKQSQTTFAQLLLKLFNILAQAQQCHKPLQLITASVLSYIAWSAEALAFYWVLSWMGADISLPFAVFVYAIAMLAGALSFMPGGLGGAEAVMIALLIWAGMPNPDAVAATVLIRLATLWFAVAIGAAFLSTVSPAPITLTKHSLDSFK
jgi:uncharacterized protein (TIRG00374 family)